MAPRSPDGRCWDQTYPASARAWRAAAGGLATCGQASRFRTIQVVLDFSRVSERLTRVRLPEFVKRCQERFVKAPRSRGNCGGIAWRGTRHSLKSAVAASAMRSTSRVEVQITTGT